MADVDYLRGAGADVCDCVADSACKPTSKGVKARPGPATPERAFVTLFNLSFVAAVPATPKTNRLTYWHVQPTDSYADACGRGRQHASELLQFFKENPIYAGSNTFGNFLVDMVAARDSGGATHGYEVGFWAAIEQVLLHAVTIHDHVDILKRKNYQPVITSKK